MDLKRKRALFQSPSSSQPGPSRSSDKREVQTDQKKASPTIEAHKLQSCVFEEVPSDFRIPAENITDAEILRELNILSFDDSFDSLDGEIFEFDELGLRDDNFEDEVSQPELFAGDTRSSAATVSGASKPQASVPRYPFLDPFPERTWGEENTIGSSLCFSQKTGLQVIPDGNNPYSFYQLLVTDEFLEHIVEETNKQAEYIFLELERTSPNARINAWKNITLPELKIFFGLLFLTGNVSQSRITDHWSTMKHYEGIFRTPAFPEHMARDRFLLILWCLHFATNPNKGEPAPEDRLYKIRYVIDYFNDRMLTVYCPSRQLGIDESNVLWRGRLSFRQYNPQKRHKYGMKLYSLTEPNGLALKILLYAGSADPEVGGEGHTNKVVIKLMSEFLNQARVLYMDNYYNSVLLASLLKKHDTYVTGTLRADRVGNPGEVKTAKLKRGEMLQRFSSDGICVMKWKDKRDILMISTEADGSLIETTNRSGVVKQKPKAIGMYNENMQGTDQTDQLLAYYPSERKTLKWYRKLGIHVINMLLNNAYLLYKRCGDKKVTTLYDFRAEVILSLLKTDFPKPSSRAVITTPPRFKRKVVTNHYPRQQRDRTLKDRYIKQMRCRQCQFEKKGQKKTSWYCPACPGKPRLCHEPCFEVWHSNIYIED